MLGFLLVCFGFLKHTGTYAIYGRKQRLGDSREYISVFPSLVVRLLWGGFLLVLVFFFPFWKVLFQHFSPAALHQKGKVSYFQL